MKIEVNSSKCIGCGKCKDVCPEGIFKQDTPGQVPQIDQPNLCFACGQCESVCPKKAIINGYLAHKTIQEEISEGANGIEFYRNHHSVRHFTEKEIRDEEINLIIEAGSNASSSHNNHNIKGIILEDSRLIGELSMMTSLYLKKTIKQLQQPLILGLLKWIAPNKVRDTEKLLGSFQGIVDANERGEDRIFFNPKKLLIFYGPKNVTFTEIDGILALGNCMNMARELGIGSFIPGYFIKASENNSDICRRLGIPKNHMVVAALALGYPKHQYIRRVKRPLMEVKKV